MRDDAQSCTSKWISDHRLNIPPSDPRREPLSCLGQIGGSRAWTARVYLAAPERREVAGPLEHSRATQG